MTVDKKESLEQLRYRVIGCAIDVSKTLGSGFLEVVYQRALAVELAMRSIPFAREFPIHVFYKGVNVGDYKADFIVDDRLILEIKAVSRISPDHEMQPVNYLAATGIEEGLIINFGEIPIGKRTKTLHYEK